MKTEPAQEGNHDGLLVSALKTPSTHSHTYDASGKLTLFFNFVL